jgi:site-specific recombinase XerD
MADIINSNKPIMTTELASIIEALEKKMIDIGYKRPTITSYKVEWRRLLRYANEHDAEEFNSEYCRRFSLESYGGCHENKYDALRATKPTKMLLDFIRFGTVFKQKNTVGSGFSDGYTELFEDFLTVQKNRGLAEGSINSIKSSLHRLERYLLDMEVMKFKDIELHNINNYVESLAGLCSTTISESLRQLGRLSNYAYEKGFHSITFSSSIPHAKNLRRQRIPHIFIPDEIQRLLSAVERDSPIGKRDYAMLMIAVRLGLRIGDIRTLQFSSIDWTKKTISFVQMKTGKFLELLLPEDVGWAIIDYMKHGRPKCESKTIFISHVYPFKNLTPAAVNLVAKYMRLADIKTPQNKRIGMHTLRHSLASEMLAQNISIEDIAGVLGHADINSTGIYIRIDIPKLRQCGLEVDI